MESSTIEADISKLKSPCLNVEN